MKRLLSLAAILLPISLFSQGFGSFSRDQPFLAGSVAASDGPASVTGLNIWYKPETLSGSNGDEIAYWADSSGNNHYGTNLITQRPYITNNIINGFPIAGCIGKTFVVNTGGATFRNTTGSTVFMLAKDDSAAGFHVFWRWQQGGGNASYRIGMSQPFNQTDWTIRCSREDGGPLDNGVNITLNKTIWVLYTYRIDWGAGAAILRTNRVTALTDASFSTPGTTSNTDSDEWGLGGSSALAEQHPNLSIAEWIVYTNYLNDADVTIVERYFTNKYAVTWP